MKRMFCSHGEPEDMKVRGCPACLCVKEFRMLMTTRSTNNIGRVVCQCDTDHPTTAYQLVEHVQRKSKICEFHKCVDLYISLCASKMDEIRLEDETESNFVTGILERWTTRAEKRKVGCDGSGHTLEEGKLRYCDVKSNKKAKRTKTSKVQT